MKIKIIISTYLIVLTTFILADTITIYNKTDRTLWISLYQQEKLSYQRMQIPQLVKKNSALTLNRSGNKEYKPCFIEELLKPVNHERLTYAEGHNFSYPPLSQEKPEKKSDIIIFFNMALEAFSGESLLAALAEFNLCVHKERIYDEIRLVIA